MIQWQQVPGDIAFAFRQIRRNPLFTICIVAILALGIGANTAIFSVIHSLLLRPLPYPEPDRLVMLWEVNPSQGIHRESVSGPTFLDWKEQNHTFDDMAAMEVGTGTLTGFGEPRQFPGMRVTSNFLKMTGAKPAAGRLFDDTDGKGTQYQNHAVLTYRMWQDLHGGSPSIVGKVFKIDLLPYTVIGVTDKDFWLPLRADGLVPWPTEMLRGRNRQQRDLGIVARLKPGVSIAEAQADLKGISDRIRAANPGLEGWTALVTPMNGVLTDSIRPALLVLFGAVSLALLIGCANIANLLLARALARQKEIAVRSALGAARGRLAQQLLTESLTLALLGGLLGILFAIWMTEGLSRLLPVTITTVDGAGDLLLRRIEVQPWVLLITTLGSVLTGLLFGLIPALEASKTDLRDVLQEGNRGSTTGSSFWRKILLGTQVAVTLLLVAGCGALLSSFLNLRRQGPGFQPDQLLTLSIELPTDARYQSNSEMRQFFWTVEGKLRDVPGVKNVGLISELPMNREDQRISYQVPDGPNPGQLFGADLRQASSGYQAALRIPLRRGRWLADSDTAERRPVAVVDEAFANRHWPNQDPIGRQLRFRSRTLEVIGVVGNVRHAGMTQTSTPTIFVSYLQSPRNRMGIALRHDGSGNTILPAVKRTVWSVDKDIPVFRVQTMLQAVESSLDNPRLTLWLVGIFAISALILSALGTYGVVAYQTGVRMREFGIRMALGAEPSTIFRLVFGQLAQVLAVAIPIGIMMAVAFNQTIRSLLPGVSATDPRILAGAALFLVLVALAASIGPAFRATRPATLTGLHNE